MPKHVKEWLNAYHDGELHGAHLCEVENHLAECAECRAELDEMQGLSALLRDTSPVDGFISTERFVSNLTLKLPRQPKAPQPRKALEIGWWLIPVSVLGTWVFIQITFSLSSLVMAASDAGLFGNTFAWFQGNPPQTQWFATLMGLFGSQLGITSQMILSPLNNADLFIQNLAGPLLLQALLAVIYLGWLVSWWLRQQSPNPNVEIGS